MADVIQITIPNLKRVQAAFAQSPSLMRAALPNAINKSLLSIGKAAVLELTEKVYNAPPAKSGYKRTGNLRSSILDPDRGLKLATGSVLQGAVGSGVGYGLFVEKGTRFMPARPYLEPAVKSQSSQVQQFFTEAVQSVFNEIARQAK